MNYINLLDTGVLKQLRGIFERLSEAHVDEPAVFKPLKFYLVTDSTAVLFLFVKQKSDFEYFSFLRSFL